MDDFRAILKGAGWQQFSIINPSEYKKFTIFKTSTYKKLIRHSHVKINNSDLLLVVTQTCDLVNDFNKEPFLEVIPLRILKRQPNKDFSYGKNSRRFELVHSMNGLNTSYFLLPYERFVVKHDVLMEIKPCGNIDDENDRNNLLGWITARYNRTAFPDTYDMRWKKNQTKIEKIIKKLELINDIYIRLSTFDELSDNQDYKVEIILLMNSDHYDDPNVYSDYENLKRKLEDEFCKCKGLIIESIDLMSSAILTLEVLTSGYHRWDYSYLSYRDPDKHEISITSY